jgi:hypothetical protein
MCKMEFIGQANILDLRRSAAQEQNAYLDSWLFFKTKPTRCQNLPHDREASKKTAFRSPLERSLLSYFNIGAQSEKVRLLTAAFIFRLHLNLEVENINMLGRWGSFPHITYPGNNTKTCH